MTTLPYIGEDQCEAIYLGNTLIRRVYLGNIQIYDIPNPAEFPNNLANTYSVYNEIKFNTNFKGGNES